MSGNGRGEQRETAIRRLDRWLWFARLAKSRSSAARLVLEGAVDLNGIAVKKPGHRVRAGDEIVLREGGHRLRLRVVGLGVRRGPAAEAGSLYEETMPRTPRSITSRGTPPRRRLREEWTPLLGEEAGMGEGRLI